MRRFLFRLLRVIVPPKPLVYYCPMCDAPNLITADDYIYVCRRCGGWNQGNPDARHAEYDVEFEADEAL